MLSTPVMSGHEGEDGVNKRWLGATRDIVRISNNDIWAEWTGVVESLDYMLDLAQRLL